MWSPYEIVSPGSGGLQSLEVVTGCPETAEPVGASRNLRQNGEKTVVPR